MDRGSVALGALIAIVIFVIYALGQFIGAAIEDEKFCIKSGGFKLEQDHCIFIHQGQNINIPMETIYEM